MLGTGSLFGEVNFITAGGRTGEAVALQNCQLIRLDPNELGLVMDEHPDLGVQIYWSFWRGLAQKLRGANEQLRTFFSEGEASETLDKLRRGEAGEAGLIDVESEDKIKVLREQGLSGAELESLTSFLEAKRFPGGTFLFHEGDEGKEMYVVLEGEVMISKFIPGGGEEALAIVNRAHRPQVH